MAGFALIQGLLSVYCIEVFDLPEKTAYAIYGAFIISIFAAPVIGGYIAGQLLGYLFTTITCLLLAVTGLYILCFQTLTHFYIGLAFFCVGNSIAVASLYVLLGRLLNNLPKIRTGAFTIAYTCMNCGALAALMASSTAIRIWGYQSTFLISAILFMVSLFVLLMNIRHYIPINQQCQTTYTMPKRVIGITALLLLLPLEVALFDHPQYRHDVILVMVVIGLGFLTSMWLKAPPEQRKKLVIFFIVSAFGIFFWTLYALEPSVLKIFVQRNVHRDLASFSVPASDFFSMVNPLSIVILGTLFSVMWLRLDKHRRSPTLPYKFAIGIGLVGLAFLVLSASTYFADTQGLISIEWVIGCYLLLGAAELFISPIGLSMVGQLTAPKNEGTAMGLWLLSNGVGSSLSFYLTKITVYTGQTTNPLNTNGLYGYRFCEFGLAALALAVILSLLSPKLVKIPV